MQNPIIPADLAIRAMRSSGYKDTAYAAAELVDNSIEAEASTVEILCADRIDVGGGRRVQRLDEIAVFDNGIGMDPAILRDALQFGNGTHLTEATQKGIGKFGMGLPNSSISQCERVDVWTWQDGECYWTYLDIDEVESGEVDEVPPPEQREIPEKWLDLISEPIGTSGTLVVWSQLDRVKWKTSRGFLDNSSMLVGRLYRYFIAEQKARIRIAAFAQNTSGEWEATRDEFVAPTDPLYLLEGTSTPAPFSDQPMFDLYGKDEIPVQYKDRTHQVNITYSIAKPKARELGGSSSPGKHAAKNIGVSLLRSGRELELNRTFDIGYDPRERWWGVEVSFPPALDDVFGVANTKQSATAFRSMNMDQDADAEGLSTEEFREQLDKEGDPRLAIYEISRRIEANLRSMRSQIRRMARGTRTQREIEEADPVESTATRATESRKEQGHVGASDRDEDNPEEQRADEIAKELEQRGLPPDQAKAIAVGHVQANLKYIFQEAAYEGASFFSVRSRGGEIIVHINERHPASEFLYDLLQQSEDEEAADALVALKLLICAWARMEDEAQTQGRRDVLSDIRTDWGRIARDFIRIAHD